ncbi:hypothetical protein [Roseiconus lacunae]|uniref:hypothetical protein n=1 Tax=Roseiconus lacunae TaxID=2605694 RepID=UPI0011F114A5|nr:hypothetical protein [Roseiconus lacunae]
MRRRTREEIEVFSTSFLDLLSCGLAAVVLLWVLLERSPPPVEEVDRFSFVSIKQFGYLHLATVTVKGLSTLPRFNENGANSFIPGVASNQSDTGYQIGDGKDWAKLIASEFDADGAPQLQFTIDDSGRNGLAGSISILVSSRCPAGEIELAFRQCESPDEHKIDVVLANSTTEKAESFTFDAGTVAGTRTVPNYRDAMVKGAEILVVRIPFGEGDAEVQYSGRAMTDQGLFDRSVLLP